MMWRRRNVLGSARVSRAGFGVSPKESFLVVTRRRKVRDSEDAIASTRDARATQPTTVA
jgi:hypothetical protein